MVILLIMMRLAYTIATVAVVVQFSVVVFSRCYWASDINLVVFMVIIVLMIVTVVVMIVVVLVDSCGPYKCCDVSDIRPSDTF